MQLKPRLQEGEHYMLVDKDIHDLWANKYKVLNEIKRYGIEDEDGGTVVEIYLKQFNVIPFPNKSLFKLYKEDPETQAIYISKAATVKDLEKKVCRLLSGYLYNVLKNKTTLVRQARLWKLNDGEIQNLKQIDQKYANYTHVKIDANILNLNED